jgi:hypothetical protein
MGRTLALVWMAWWSPGWACQAHVFLATLHLPLPFPQVSTNIRSIWGTHAALSGLLAPPKHYTLQYIHLD